MIFGWILGALTSVPGVDPEDRWTGRVMCPQGDSGGSAEPSSTAAHASGEASFEQLRLTAEMASDQAYQTNPAGIIEWVSPSVIHVLGWNPKEITGSPSIDLVHPEDVPGVQADGARHYAGETVEEHVIRLRTCLLYTSPSPRD